MRFELNNKVAEPFITVVTTYLALKNFDGAIADFERAIKLEPDMAWAYQGRGTALMTKAIMLRAIDDFNRAIELDPENRLGLFQSRSDMGVSRRREQSAERL